MMLPFSEILCASLSKCQRLLDIPLNISEENALQRLHYIDAFGLKKFSAVMYKMPAIIEEHPEVHSMFLLLFKC